MRWILNSIVFAIAFGASGQDLSIAIDKEEVLIGEPFVLKYTIVSDTKIDTLVYAHQEVLFAAKNSANATEVGVSTPYELEVLKEFKDTSYTKEGQFFWEGSYELTGWDSAYVVIPPQHVQIEDSIHTFPAGLIYINSPVADPSKPIYDINEAFTELPKEDGPLLQFLKNNWWWLSLMGLGIIGVVVFLATRKRKEPTPLSLRQSTLQKIDLLEKSKGYESNLKEYYFDLSIILRRFFAAHYQERILDKTTGEIESILSDYGLDQKMVLLTRQLLTQSDMVKFAQSKPSLEEIQSITNDARRVVNEVADLDLENE